LLSRPLTTTPGGISEAFENRSGRRFEAAKLTLIVRACES
jgi:hypothetical protein